MHESEVLLIRYGKTNSVLYVQEPSLYIRNILPTMRSSRKLKRRGIQFGVKDQQRRANAANVFSHCTNPFICRLLLSLIAQEGLALLPILVVDRMYALPHRVVRVVAPRRFCDLTIWVVWVERARRA